MAMFGVFGGPQNSERLLRDEDTSGAFHLSFKFCFIFVTTDQAFPLKDIAPRKSDWDCNTYSSFSFSVPSPQLK